MPEADVAYLSQALLTLDVFSAPNIGTFYRKPVPARIDPETNQIHPPGFRVEFIPFSQTHVEDFERFLSALHDLSEDEAKTLAGNISARAAGLLYRDKALQLPGAGRLLLKKGGAIVYEPSEEQSPDDSNYGLTPAILQAPADADRIARARPAPVLKNARARKRIDKKAAAEYALLVSVAVILFGALLSLFFFQTQISEALGGHVKPANADAEQWERVIAEAENLPDEIAPGSDSVRADSVGGLIDTSAADSQPNKAPGSFHIIAETKPGKTEADDAAARWAEKGYETRVIPNQQRASFRVSIFSAETENAGFAAVQIFARAGGHRRKRLDTRTAARRCRRMRD